MMGLMKITREKHATYILKAAAILALAYFIQSYLYLNFGPQELAREIVASLGFSLVCLIGAFLFHDKFHEIKLHANHLEIKFSPLKLHRELFYRNIQNIHVKKSRRDFADVVIELRDGSTISLHHVDDPHEVQKTISDRRTS